MGHRFARVFRELSNNSRVLDLVHRYETGFDRQFSRALSLILKLRDSQWSETETPDALPPSAGALPTWAPDSPRDAPPHTAANSPNEPTSVQPFSIIYRRLTERKVPRNGAEASRDNVAEEPVSIQPGDPRTLALEPFVAQDEEL